MNPSLSSPIYIPLISHLCTNSWPLLSHKTIPAQHRVHLTEVCFYLASQLMKLQPLKQLKCFSNCYLLHYFANLIHNNLHVYRMVLCSKRFEVIYIDCCIYIIIATCVATHLYIGFSSSLDPFIVLCGLMSV